MWPRRNDTQGLSMSRLLFCCGPLPLFVGAALPVAAQLPSGCKPPASAGSAPAGTSPARVYDAIGVWFAQKGDLKCSEAAFNQALRLEPHLAEAHFDLGLLRQNQQQND